MSILKVKEHVTNHLNQESSASILKFKPAIFAAGIILPRVFIQKQYF